MPKIVFESRGNVELLSQNRIALFSSRNPPDELRTSAIRLFDALRNLPVCLCGGWQAPPEKMLLRKVRVTDRANYIIYLARDLNRFKPTSLQQHLLDEQKLLIVAPELSVQRPSAVQIDLRDRLLFHQVKKILFLHIRPGGRLEAYFNELSQSAYQIYVLEHTLNKAYFSADVTPVSPGDLDMLL